VTANVAAGVSDREAAVAAWRRAEAVVYPSVMVNAVLYEQYIQVVRAIVDELRDVHSEDELIRTWREQRDLGADMVRRVSPSMGALMDVNAVRDAAFCQRHRETMREHAKEIAHDRLVQARITGAPWVVLFEDVTAVGIAPARDERPHGPGDPRVGEDGARCGGDI